MRHKLKIWHLVMISGLLLVVFGVGFVAQRVFAPFDRTVDRNVIQQVRRGRQIFRSDTFGNQAFWGDVLRLHDAIKGEDLGGVGPGVSPQTALAVGLKVDLDSLPPQLVRQIQAGQVDLNDPATTIALLQLDAVVGVKGFFDENGDLVSLGITCAICHSTVDDSLTAGIGHRLDGWANRDLNIGVVISLAPNLEPVSSRLHVDVDTLKAVLNSWGPGKFDAVVLHDGKAFNPETGLSGATLIPPAFGLAGVNLHTWNGWGSVPYWNAYVANTQMRGQGTFYDPRLNDPQKYPLAVETGDWNKRSDPDLVTAKLPALHIYQLSIPAPKPPQGFFDPQAAARGETIFNGKANCDSCHVPPLYTEPGWNMHSAEELGIDDFQASRSPDDNFYRTAPLKGLWTHMKGGFYHDGRFGTLLDVVNHYDVTFGLNLTAAEKADLVEFLKSLGDAPVD
jgi:hypothetical protein